MERRSKNERPTGYFSMVADKEVLDNVKVKAKEANMSLSAFVEKLMKLAIEDKIQQEPQPEIKEEVREIKEELSKVSKKITTLNDKVDCVNIIVTKMSSTIE